MSPASVLRRASLPLVLVGGLAAGCGGSPPPPPPPPVQAPDAGPPEAVREEPPASGAARDISFPPIHRTTLENGLEVNTVELHALPAVYVRLVVESGTATDPAATPGLADLVASMLKEGTRRRTSAQLADAIEFLGADMSTHADKDRVEIGFQALSEHLDQALDLVADVATEPAFREDELQKLKRRELNRLQLMASQPEWLARRSYHAALYGQHPYAHVDTTPEVVQRLRRNDLVRWHRERFVPSNAYLVVVGDVTPARVEEVTRRVFGRWRGSEPPAATPAAPPQRTARQILVVDRPGSVQSVIRIGNLAIPRSDADWIPLQVANQVLGGSAASRLFMDLREQRSLTYGAYSYVDETRMVAPFTAMASVETSKTLQAVGAFFEHLDRIVAEVPPEEELRNAQRFLSDSFPLQIETPSRVAAMVAELRLHDLPDDYWDSFRTRIGTVTAEEALGAAQRHIRPTQAVIVVVGQAADFAEGLRAYGDVTVLDGAGVVKQTLTAATPPAPSAAEGEAPSE